MESVADLGRNFQSGKQTRHRYELPMLKHPATNTDTKS